MPSNNILTEVAPQFSEPHWLVILRLICAYSNFPSCIRIGYVVRREGGYSYVMRPALEEVGVSLEILHNLALDNLRAMPIGGLQVGQTPGGPRRF